MDYNAHDIEFWANIDKLVTQSKIVIDRPKGSRHPRFNEIVYPVDYGYLDGTSSMDGGGIDVWVGNDEKQLIDAVMCIVDMHKRDSEIKILIGCNDEEKRLIYELHNDKLMRGIMILR